MAQNIKLTKDERSEAEARRLRRKNILSLLVLVFLACLGLVPIVYMIVTSPPEGAVGAVKAACHNEEAVSVERLNDLGQFRVKCKQADGTIVERIVSP